MKYSYSIDIIKHQGGEDFIFRLSEDMKVVQIFINSDLMTERSAKECVNLIDKTLSGNSLIENFSGNLCFTSIKAEATIIEYSYSSNDNKYEIETLELKALIEAYIEEKKKFLSKN